MCVSDLTIIIYDLEFIMTIPSKIDILEIGAIAIDHNFNIKDNYFVKCKPVRYKYNNRVKSITRMDENYYYSGINNKEGLIKFFKWAMKFKNPLFCSWSNYDQWVLKNRLKTLPEIHQIIVNDSIEVFDIQRSYMLLAGLKDSPSLDFAMEVNNISLVKDFDRHNALSDCYYTYDIVSLNKDYYLNDMLSKPLKTYDIIGIGNA